MIKNKMSGLFRIISGLFLSLHGLVHLMGTLVYLKLAEIEGLPYKTALLNGNWEVGEAGMIVFGVLWAAAGAGFVFAGLAWLARKKLNKTLLLLTGVFSLALAILDFQSAYTGAVISGFILILVLISPVLERILIKRSER